MPSQRGDFDRAVTEWMTLTPHEQARGTTFSDFLQKHAPVRQRTMGMSFEWKKKIVPVEIVGAFHIDSDTTPYISYTGFFELEKKRYRASFTLKYYGHYPVKTDSNWQTLNQTVKLLSVYDNPQDKMRYRVAYTQNGVDYTESEVGIGETLQKNLYQGMYRFSLSVVKDAGWAMWVKASYSDVLIQGVLKKKCEIAMMRRHLAHTEDLVDLLLHDVERHGILTVDPADFRETKPYPRWQVPLLLNGMHDLGDFVSGTESSALRRFNRLSELMAENASKEKE